MWCTHTRIPPSQLLAFLEHVTTESEQFGCLEFGFGLTAWRWVRGARTRPEAASSMRRSRRSRTPALPAAPDPTVSVSSRKTVVDSKGHGQRSEQRCRS